VIIDFKKKKQEKENEIEKSKEKVLDYQRQSKERTLAMLKKLLKKFIGRDKNIYSERSFIHGKY